jgi:hypothetical protein
MKTRSLFVLTGIALIGLLIIISACKNEAPPSAPAVDNQKTSNAPAPAPQTAPGGKGGWLEGIPPAVPVFAYGKMKSDSYKGPEGNKQSYYLYYEGVTIEQVREYMGKTKAAGFQVTEAPTSRPGELSAFGNLPQGEGSIGYTIGYQPGHLDLSVTVVKKFE